MTRAPPPALSRSRTDALIVWRALWFYPPHGGDPIRAVSLPPEEKLSPRAPCASLPFFPGSREDYAAKFRYISSQTRTFERPCSGVTGKGALNATSMPWIIKFSTTELQLTRAAAGLCRWKAT